MYIFLYTKKGEISLRKPQTRADAREVIKRDYSRKASTQCNKK